MTDARANAEHWLSDIKKLLDTSNAALEGLIVEVRSDWGAVDARAPSLGEYRIRLSSSVRIWGTLGVHGEPQTAKMEILEEGIPWTVYPADESLLLAFAAHFYFGG